MNLETDHEDFLGQSIEWRDIPGYEGKYKVSNDGRVLSLNYNRTGKVVEMKPRPHKDGYVRADLSMNGKVRVFLVHQLVLLSFVGSRPDGCEIAHLNGIRDDNRLENLQYVTASENNSHKVLHGTDNRGVKHFNSRLTEDDVIQIVSRLDRGELQRDLAEEYGVGRKAISKINLGYNWNWLTNRQPTQ